MRSRSFPRRRASFTVTCLLLTFIASASRAAVITVEDKALEPDTPNQSLRVIVSGADPVAGLDLFVQVGDGGAFNNGADTKPVITAIDVTNGTIFAGNNTGQAIDPTQASHPLIWATGTTTAAGTVAASGLLATLTIDTTGFTGDSFRLLLTNVAANTTGPFDTQLTTATGGVAPGTVSGTTTVPVPEPAPVVLLAPLLALVLRARRRQPTVLRLARR
jgi:hypothetical protein